LKGKPQGTLNFPGSCKNNQEKNPSMIKEREQTKTLFPLLKSLAREGHFSLALTPNNKVKIEWGEETFKEKLGFLPSSLPPELPPSLHPQSQRKFKAWWLDLLRGKSVVSDFCFLKNGKKEIWIRAFGHPQAEEKKKKIIRITGFLQDVTREKKLENLLREREAFYRRIIDESVEGFFQSTPDGRFLKANKAIAQILGYKSPQDLIKAKQPLAKISYVNPDQRQEYLKLMKEKGQVKGFIFQIRRSDGQVGWLLENARAVRDRKGRTLYFEGHVQDITQLKETERALAESQARLESLIDAASDLIYFKDNDRRYVIINRSFEKTLGLKKEVVLGRRDEEILPADLAAQCRQSDEEVLNSRKITVREEIMQTGRKKKVVFETIKSPVLAPDGSIAGLVGISRDISARKKAEAELRSLVREKETLLREIHHRVKNNMQVISSLLNLQAQKIEDLKAREAFQECQERIRSMALIHDQLYQQESLHWIEFSSYLRNLVTHLFHVYQIDAHLIKLRLETEPAPLSLNTAIPCGLIVNELVTNALKHAFLPGEKGEIVISLKQKENGHYLLRIKDTGRGLPQDINLKEPASLGLQIVTILVNQIGGQLEFKVDGGTEFLITFREHSFLRE
jgi:PAS domain S-box-containing protein